MSFEVGEAEEVLASASPPGRVVADSGYFANRNLERMEELAIDTYLPDSNLARELKTWPANSKPGPRTQNLARELNPGCAADDRHCRDPRQHRVRETMRSEAGRTLYRKRKSIVEPIFGVLKQQRNLREFRMRSLEKAAIEFALAATAYNLSRIHRML